jgi:hypothetical protein
MSSSKRLARRWIPYLLMTLAMLVVGQPVPTHAQPASDCRSFPETAKEVCGLFLSYWNEHGGLTQQGFPMTGEFNELSSTNGKTYTVQYFERAVFEKHPENKPPYDVLLSLLGNAFYSQKYPGGAPNQQANTSTGSMLFPETGKRLGGRFLDYWRTHGGLMQQGYPISNEFMEKSDLNGQTYRVQYFERAVFEYHPEEKPPFDVLLSQLGTYYVKQKYPNGDPDPWSALRRRPLKLPTIPPGSDCFPGKGVIVAPQFGVAYGSGQVYAVLGAEENATIYYDGSWQEGGWFYYKVLWIARPTFQGAILVRGQQLDGPNELRFGDGPDPAKELTFITDNQGIPSEAWSDWSDWPTQTRFKGPGCYAFQVDTSSSTQVIIFKVVQAP